MTVTVAEWISYDDAVKLPKGVGGGGGWVTGEQWHEFITDIEPKRRPYYEAIRASVVEHGFRFSGEEHQYSPQGVPRFNDGTVGMFSFRAWGDLMAAIWNTENADHGYTYLDFYMR